MATKTIVLLLVTLAFTSVRFAEAQQQTKLPKIGWLATRSASASGPELFTKELRALGHIEGKNIAFEYRFADDKVERLPALADELVRLKPEVLVTPAFTAALALKNATRTIPVVFISNDPVGTGLVDSLARPGGNITGFTNIESVLAGKRLELLKETVLKLSRVAVLWNPKNQGSEQSWKESLVSARELGLQLYSMEVSNADSFDSAFKEATKARSDSLAVTLNALANSNQKRIVDLATKNRWPAIYARSDFVESGGLMSYGPDQAEAYRRVAWMVDKILKGAKPSDIPVEQPTKFELVINLKTAKAIGLVIPPVVMMRAEKVIK